MGREGGKKGPKGKEGGEQRGAERGVIYNMHYNISYRKRRKRGQSTHPEVRHDFQLFCNPLKVLLV